MMGKASAKKPPDRAGNCYWMLGDSSIDPEDQWVKSKNGNAQGGYFKNLYWLFNSFERYWLLSVNNDPAFIARIAKTPSS